MAEKKNSLKRKLVHAGGWQLVRRGAKMLPFGGTLVAVSLVGFDVRKKGLVRGVVNSGLDAIPIVGLAKNAVELLTGDFIPDKEPSSNGRKRGK